jgi:hypothetical protein
VLDGGPVSFEQVQLWLDELSALVEAKNISGLVQTFQRIVPEYKPSEEVLALCEVDRHDMALMYRRARKQLWHSASDMPNHVLPAQLAMSIQGSYEQPH